MSKKEQPESIESTTAKQLEFMALYGNCHTRLARFCRAVSRDNEEAKDLLSETVLKVYEGFSRIEKPESFLYFLFGTASRLHKKKLRRLKFKGIFSQEHAENIVDHSLRPDASLELQMLFDAMRKLPAEQCEALTLFEISGLSLKEIQMIQDCSLSAVKQRIARARQKLAKMLGTSEENITLPAAENGKIATETMKTIMVNFLLMIDNPNEND